LDDGRCDFLAVTSIVAGAQDGTEIASASVTPSVAAGVASIPPVAAVLAAAPTVATAAALSNTVGAMAAPLAADQVALPYPLPD
jgi:hypothetical protein